MATDKINTQYIIYFVLKDTRAVARTRRIDVTTYLLVNMTPRKMATRIQRQP